MKLSEHFSLEEFFCHSGAAVPASLIPNVQALVDGVLEPLRIEWGAPLVIVCGYRDPAYNKALYDASLARALARGEKHGGVAEKSEHLEAKAADVKPLNPDDLPRLFSTVEEMHVLGKLPALGGFGTYPSMWTHLDIEKAADGHLRRWIGHGMGSAR